MKLSEAIKELEKDIEDFGGPGTSPICQAENLSIETLKGVLAWRNDNNDDFLWDFPGETEE